MHHYQVSLLSKMLLSHHVILKFHSFHWTTHVLGSLSGIYASLDHNETCFEASPCMHWKKLLCIYLLLSKIPHSCPLWTNGKIYLIYVRSRMATFQTTSQINKLLMRKRLLSLHHKVFSQWSQVQCRLDFPLRRSICHEWTMQNQNLWTSERTTHLSSCSLAWYHCEQSICC